MVSTAVIIPARRDSTRFPNKPMALLNGVPMVVHVANKCKESGLDVWIVTDDTDIGYAAVDAGYAGRVFCNIESEARNGTERVAETIGYDIFDQYDRFINVQGDMPDITADIIHRVDQIIEQSGVATVYADMPEHLQKDPNTVKVVHNNVYAHWFGRGITYGSQHLGVYGYTRKALERYNVSTPNRYEELEGLEQLRWFDINLGYRVAIRKVDFNGIEINTPEDLERWHESR